MQKSKESLERKLKNNKEHPHEVAQTLEMRYNKSARTKESAVLPGLGSKNE